MTRPQAPKGIDMATWLRLRAERRGQLGVVAGYVHELSDRHNGAEHTDERGSTAASAGRSEPTP